MRVIIAGSRTLIDPLLIPQAIKEAGFTITEIVTGMARGVDTLAFFFAVKHDIPRKPFPAKWKEFGRDAGFLRNQEMADYGDALIAIWDGKSRGTVDMVNRMKELDKPVHLWRVNDDQV